MSNKAIFLDRDDTLIEDPGYIDHPDQVKLLDGATEALSELKAMGYKLVIVSNQSGIARGILTEKKLNEIHKRLKQLLVEKGVHLDNIYYCPYHPDGTVEKYRKETECRKPNHGMLTKAAQEMSIDLDGSWMIGNSSRDVEAGLRAGCTTIQLDSPSHQTRPEPGEPIPHYRAVNLKEAVNIVKKQNRSSNKPDHQGQTAQLQSENTQIAKPANSQAKSAEQNIPDDRTEQLLSGILEQLRKTHRADMFSEFSIMRLLAGIIQITVLFCLLISVWFLMSPNTQYTAVFVSLAFAMVLQLIALTFYMMQGRK